MFYRIHDTVALRSWQGTPMAYYKQTDPYAHRLSPEEFNAMVLCDGEHDLLTIPESLLSHGLIEPCDKGNHPSEWSKLHRYDNRYFPKMNLMITGKCNYNCLHCFNAADNAPLMSEWSFTNICDLLEQADACGIHAFTITGGEPMIHPRFLDILKEITRHGMFVEELNTNGYFITQEILDQMKAIGSHPVMKISFDGIGCHDWMRARKGSEERTLSAIRLCVQNGFEVKIQTQVNQKTIDSLLPTLTMLEKENVSSVRLIRTTEVDRWINNAKDATISLLDYYEKMLSLVSKYKQGNHRMSLTIWQFLSIYPSTKAYEMVPITCAKGKYRKKAPVCKGNRGMIGITSEGEVVPCLQMSGYYKEHGISLGNVHDTSLKELLTDSRYVETICYTVEDLKKANNKCASCAYYEYCCGGCRALGLLLSGDQMDMNGSDISKCQFFEHGWVERIRKTFADWRWLNPIPKENKTDY